VSIILERSVNYFRNFRVECHLLKIGCDESISSSIGGVGVIYPIIFFLNEIVISNRLYIL
jgi:hypothetical protein